MYSTTMHNECLCPGEGKGSTQGRKDAEEVNEVDLIAD
jgi:hypothetical protein